MKTLKYLFVGFIILGLVSMFSVAHAAILMVPDPYTTIQDAVDAANPAGGDTIIVDAGDYTGALIQKPVEIIGMESARIVEPVRYKGYGWGFFVESSNVKISNFTIEPYWWCAAVGIDGRYMDPPPYGQQLENVIISHMVINNPFWGIHIARTKNCVIEHNTINGLKFYELPDWYALYVPRIGIKLTASRNQNMEGNLIAFNKVIVNESSGYPGDYSGILFEAGQSNDFGVISNNKLVHNKIQVSSSIPESRGIALDLRDYRNNSIYDIDGNLIGFNDFRESDLIINEIPEAVADAQVFSRNLGDVDNRANDGVDPTLYIPDLP